MLDSEHRPSAVQLRRLLQVYASALRDNPSDLNLRTKLAEVLRLLGRSEEAIALYSSVAWAYGVSGNLGQAIMICKLILELNPEHSVTQEMLAKLYASKQIREQKQSVPVQQVGGRWVADPRGSTPPESAEVAAADPPTAFGAVDDRALPRPASARGLASPAEQSGTARPTPPPALAEDAARARAASAPERAAGSARKRSEHPTSHELPSGRRRPSSESVAASPPTADSAPAVRAATPPTAQPTGPTDEGAPVYRRELPTYDELPPSAREPTRVEAIAPESSRPRPFVIRSGPAGQLERADEHEAAPPDDLRPTQQLSAVRKLPLAEPLPDARDELAGGPEPELASPAEPPPIPSSPSADVPLADAAAPATAGEPLEELASALEPEPVVVPVPTRDDDEEAVESLAAPPPAPPRPDAATPPQPTAPAPPTRPRRITRPGFVITGPIEPATSKNLKTTRRYATQERAQDSPAAPREVATPPPARQLPVSPAEPVGSTTQPLPGIPVLPPQAPAVPGFEPQQRLTPPPALPSYPELPASAAEEVEGAAPAPSAAPAARALERESTDVDPDAEREITDVDPDAEREITDVDPDAERATDPVAEALPAPAVSARDAAPTTVNPAVEPWIVAAEAATARPQVKPTVRMDGAAINSMLRMDAEHAFSQRPAVGYASIQREVWSAGNEQAEAEIEAVEVERAEQNLLDTIREAPAEIEFTEDGIERHVNPFPLFSDLDASAFLAVVRRVERRVCPPGTVIFNEGDPGDSLYLVASGVLQVLKDPGGQPIQLARLGSGSFFGEFGLLTDGRRHATVRCLEECELLELRREVLIELSAEHPTISWTLRTFYQQRVMAMVMATSPLFQAVSAEERKSVLARFTFRRFMAGEQIVREGKQGTGFYVILVGTALVTCMAADGSDMKLGVLGEGNYFGEMSLLSGCVAEASVRAETVIEVLMLEPQDFYSMAAEHPEIWAVVQDEAERRREDTAQRLARGAAAAVNRLCLI